MKNIIKIALKEDIGSGDVTTSAIVPKGLKVKANIIAKESGVIAGLEIAKEVFRQVDKKIKFQAKIKDGVSVNNGEIIAVISGPARGILTGERVALNFLQHLSGIASLTRRFVDRGQGTENRAKILDTRKTTPGLRVLEKYAVKMGGGVNHRMGLYDAILIKDNHIAAAGGVLPAIKAIKKKLPIEIEATTLEEVEAAIEGKVKRVLLDNMPLETLRKAVAMCRAAKIETEASGGVTLDNVAAIAATGVDYISVGAITHSAKALDVSLEII